MKIDIKEICNDFLENEPMKLHTTFKIGGNADLVLFPHSSSEMAKIVENVKTPYVFGGGSNILVNDSGIRGVVVLTEKINNLSVEGNVIEAGCGVKLSRIAQLACTNSLTGFEFASGIPGSLGGSVMMNAGAYGFEMKDVIKDVTCCDENGKIFVVKKEDCGFSYRHSVFSEKKLYVLSAKIELQKGEKTEITEKMNELAKMRREKQPLEFPSAGSTFKRPQGYFAGKLISDCDLKGKTFGGAQVSEKHAGFVINKGNATFDDVVNLIEFCKKTVWEKFGVELEPEVKIIY